jgi:hypothetical protein
MDIAATVNPATVHFRSLTEPSRVSVLEQNYEMTARARQIAASIGREVTLIRLRRDDNTTREEEVRRACSVTTTHRSGRSAARS